MSVFSFLHRAPAADTLLAVDVLSDGVSVVRLRRGEGVAPVLDVVGFVDSADPGQQSTGLKSLVRHHGLERYPCTTLLSPDEYSLLLVDSPDVPSEELRAAMRWRIKDLIDFHVDDAVVDVFDVPGHKGAAGSRMLYVVAARAEAVRRRIDLLEAAGLKLSTIDVQELALRNLAALLPEDVPGLALVYLTLDHGFIVLTRQSTLHLARRFRTGLAGLEQNGGPTALQAVLDNLVVEVQRSMDYYDSHFALPPINSLVMAPMPVPVAGVVEHLSRELGLAVRQMDLNALVDIDEPLDTARQVRCLPVVGAGLRVEETLL